MSMDEWRNMGEMMGGIGAMGGPPAGLLPPASTAAGAGKPDSMMAAMMELHERMMSDPVIRKRIESDTALQRLMHEVMGMPMSTEKPKTPLTPSHSTRRPSAAAKPSVKPPVKPATFELR
jgi:hypothetical protein